tara:strand:- start:11910 stop:12785 length:876 start_codon:yes stop_codon:yes gene_type:complete
MTKHSVPMSVLAIHLTAKCNMDCSFCKGADYMVQTDTSQSEQSERMNEVLANHEQVKHIVWSGGEPLLALRRAMALAEEARELAPNARQQFLTNGRKLKLNQVEKLKTFDQVTVSIDGYEKGERTIQGFLDEGVFEAFETMYALDNIDTWSVVTSQQLWDGRWYEDIIKLHNSIFHLGFKSIGLILDKFMEKPLFTDQLLNFVYGYKQINENMHRLNKEYGTEVFLNLPGFFRHYHCNACSESGEIEPNGGFVRSTDCTPIEDAGCSNLASVIGVENYKYINKFLRPNAGA